MSPASTSAGAPAATVNPHTFILDVDILLLCILGLFFLVALPGAVAFFVHRSEWTEGVWFRKIATSTSIRRFSAKAQFDLSTPRPAPIAITLNRSDGYDTEKGLDIGSDKYYISPLDLTPSAHGGINPPAHFRSWSSRLPLIHEALAYPVRPGYSVGKVILVLVYSGIMIFAGFYENNPFTAAQRAGYVFASQVPFIIILATKNNVVGWLLGCGYEKLNFLHRLAGRFGVLAVNVHGITYIYKYSAEGSFWAELVERPNVAWGFVGLIAADILFLLSTSIVRQLCYPLFYVSHILMAALFLIALCVHEPWASRYVIGGVVFYALDRVIRLIRSRYTTAHLTALPELGMTRIEIPGVNAGWRAGQHVRIKVISSAMGWFGWAETHPFTIASVSKGEDGLVVMCKKAGDWTNKLYQLAQRTDYSENGSGRSSVRVIVDGPYGGPGHSVLASHSGAMFVVGGSGITYALGTVRDLIHRAVQGNTRVKAVELVWSIPDPASLAPLLPLFSTLLAESEQLYTRLRISVFYTRAPSSPEAFSSVQVLPSGLTLSAGRPKLGKVIEGVLDRTRASAPGSDSIGPLTGVVVGVCGPLALGEEVGRAVRSIPSERAKAVGGIELHTEIFGW